MTKHFQVLFNFLMPKWHVQITGVDYQASNGYLSTGLGSCFDKIILMARPFHTPSIIMIPAGDHINEQGY